MKNSTDSRDKKSKTLGLALATMLVPAAMASAYVGHAAPVAVRSDLSGHVEVVHQVPGGTVTVGADWGKQRRPEPAVVVVQEPPQVVEVREIHHRRHHGREVTIIHEQPREQVTVIREQPARREVVVVENRPGRGGEYDRPDGVREERRPGDDHYYHDGKQVSYDHNGQDGQYHYYKDANQVSETKVTRNGSYHYYEDANQVSIQDNRDGRQRNVYVRK